MTAPLITPPPPAEHVFDDFAETAIADVRRSYPMVSPIVVAELVRAYRPFTLTPTQAALACRERLREALSY